MAATGSQSPRRLFRRSIAGNLAADYGARIHRNASRLYGVLGDFALGARQHRSADAQQSRQSRLSAIYLQAASDHDQIRSEEHTSELQSLMRISYAIFCLHKKN